MDTRYSDEFVEKWRERENPLHRASIVLQREIACDRQVLFRLLCPTTEYDWLPDWKCTLLHSESGYAEHNVIFSSNFLGQPETWICTRFEPGRCIHYVRASRDYLMKLEITLAGGDGGIIRVVWDLNLSALTEEGNRMVDMCGEAEKRVGKCLDALEYYVANGVMVQ